MTQQTSPSEIARIFDAAVPEPEAAMLAELGPRYNVAPTQPLAVVLQREEGRFVELHRWGLVPAWSKSVGQQGARLINARAETVADSPAYRNSFLRRRCLVPADGFYEWQKPPGGKGPKAPHWIHLPDQRPFAMAGLWERWGPKDDPLLTYTILTTRAGPDVQPYHPRQPVLLPRDAWDAWLARDTAPGVLMEMLAPPPAGTLDARRVGIQVNAPAHDEADCIEALTFPTGEGGP